MKKLGTLALCAALIALTAAPAMARTIGVDVDGKVYTFYEDCGDGAPDGAARYEMDGKTFFIGTDEVIVQEEGKPDLHLTLESEDSIATDTMECVSEVTVGTTEANGEYCVAEDNWLARDWSAADAAEYAPFAPYGLRCDAEAGKLYYLGVPVRVFEDARDVDGGTAELDYFDAAGAVDVRALRDSSGALTGLEPLSAAEFAARDLSKWTNPEPVRMESTATEEGERMPEESAAFFAPYAPFGLRYDAKTDRLYFRDRPVRDFLDVRQSNGEPMNGGNFHGSLTQMRFDGEVDVTVLRDYAHPDAHGDGKLIGLEATEAETKEK